MKRIKIREIFQNEVKILQIIYEDCKGENLNNNNKIKK